MHFRRNVIVTTAVVGALAGYLIVSEAYYARSISPQGITSVAQYVQRLATRVMFTALSVTARSTICFSGAARLLLYWRYRRRRPVMYSTTQAVSLSGVQIEAERTLVTISAGRSGRLGEWMSALSSKGLDCEGKIGILGHRRSRHPAFGWLLQHSVSAVGV